MLDVSRVMVGTPDQKTTGAISDAPVGTALPTSAADELSSAFTSSGYVSSDGLSLSVDRSTSDIQDWSGNTVRKLLESFDSTLSWSEMQMSKEALIHAFGEANVSVTPATSGHGEQIAVQIGAELPEVRSWVIRMKDGSNRMMVVVPKGQVTEIDEITFAASDAIALPLTLSTYPDDNGVNVYVYFDDGTVVTA